MVHLIGRLDHLVPLVNHEFVHGLHIFKTRPEELTSGILELQYVGVTPMLVTCHKNIRHTHLSGARGRFTPATPSLKGWCSLGLSYPRIKRNLFDESRFWLLIGE